MNIDMSSIEIPKRIDNTPDAVDPQPLTTFDFEDGKGPVPAHQHPNGGGWVADTATVDVTAYVGPNARVFGIAWVFDDARLTGTAQVFGNARLTGNAWVFNTWVSTGLVTSTAPKEQA